MNKNAETNNHWRFIDSRGRFQLDRPQDTSYLYFPLVNEAGMMSAISPELNGDSKTGQNAFLTQPVSVEDLHNNRSNRNFWVSIEGYGLWSVSGNSAIQIAHRYEPLHADRVSLRAVSCGMKSTRENRIVA
jgi:hypothetical protein